MDDKSHKAVEIEPQMTSEGMALRSFRFPDGGLGHIMGDCLPDTAEENERRKEEFHRICEGIILKNAGL